MKDKKTILLTCAVVCIWGIIGYRIYSGLNADEPFYSPREVRRSSSAVDSLQHYTLVLNYPDPFLKQQYKSRQPARRAEPRVIRKPVVTPAKSEPGIVVNWEKVKYFGGIYNTSRGSWSASVRIDGTDYSARPGDRINDFEILEIFQDSIKISFSSQIKFIRKAK